MIVGLILAVGWGLDKILIHYGEQDNLSSDKTKLRGSFLYIQGLLTSPGTTVTETWNQHSTAINKRLGYPVEIYQLSDFYGDQDFLSALQSGRIVTLADKNNALIYYKNTSDQHHIIALGPLPDSPSSYETLVISVYYLLVAVILFLWLRPFSKDLHELCLAAMRFGDNNFSTRVTVNQNSSILPVADAFNSMAQRIEDLASAHKDLTHAVSHELKTPLSRFKFSLEMIEQSDHAKQRTAYLRAMKDDVRELDELIEEMLRYAQFSVDNLTLNLESVVTKDCLQDIISCYDLDKHQISIQCVVNPRQQPDIIRIDKQMMSRAVHNLIRNGLQYAHSQLCITLRLMNNTICLQIEDDGPGIPAQYRNQIFQPSTRLDSSRNRQSGGHGLGLAITQKIVQQHNGRIHVFKLSLDGAGFQLTWPD